MVVFLALSLLPLGSNYPFLWSVNGAVSALLFLAYAVRKRFDPGAYPVPLRAFYLPGALFGISLVWMLIQVLPLPADLARPEIWAPAAEALGRSVTPHISVDPSATAAMMLRQMTFGFVFLVAAELGGDPARARRLLRALFWLLVAHAGLALAMLLIFDDQLIFFPKDAYRGYATGFFVNRNAFAASMAIAVALGTSQILAAILERSPTAPSPRRRWSILQTGMSGTLIIDLAGILIAATALLLSGSRMGVFSACAGAAVSFIFGFAGRRRGRQLIGIGGVALLATGIVLAFSGAGFIDRIGDLPENAGDRLELYRQVVGMIAARPLTGFGGGTFAIAFPLFHHLPLNVEVTWDAAHNLYLELAAELGVFGLAPLAAVGVCVWRIFKRGRRRSRLVSTSALAVVTAGALHSIVDFPLQIEANALFFAVILGTAFGAVSRKLPAASKDKAQAGADNFALPQNRTLTASDNLD